MLNLNALEGRITVTPELKSTKSGTPVTSFHLAVDRGDKENNTDFIPVVAYGKLAEFASKYLTKGRLISVRGSIRQNDYTDKEGKKRTSFNVKADEINFLDKKPQEQLEPYSDDEDYPF